MLELYRNIEHQLMFVLAEMELEGFKVDVEMLGELEKEFDRRTDALSKQILDLAGKTEEFNLNSTKQLGVLLFEELNLPVVKKTKTGYSTYIEVLEKLNWRHPIYRC
jgi:DNA polymerase-1